MGLILWDYISDHFSSTMLRIGGQKVPGKVMLLVATDVGVIFIGLFVSIVLRFPHWNDALAYINGTAIVPRCLVVTAVCLLTLYYCDLYDFQVVGQRIESLLGLLRALGMACLVLALLFYFVPDLSLGRGISVLAAVTILILLFAWRLSAGAVGLTFSEPERVLVMGTGPAGIQIVREILARPDLHLRVVGFLDERGENIGKSLVNPGIVGATAEVEEIVAHQKIDRVILSLAERRGRMPVRQLLHLKFAGVGIEDAHSFNERISGRILLEHLSPSWLILSGGFRKSTLLLAAKRTVDVVVSFVALVAFLPLMLLVGLAVWLESRSPILFRQERVGLHGKIFQMLKFRSMHQNAEENGPSWAVAYDRRVTRVGKLIRKLRIDEFPQFLNVLRGEMSLVGPRPERPCFCEMLEERIPFFSLRHTTRPGITGWAQIKYQYGGSVEEAKTKLGYDLFYIKHMSIFLDFAVLFETGKVMLSGRGAK